MSDFAHFDRRTFFVLFQNEGDDLQHLDPSTSLGLATSAATNAHENAHASVIANDFTLSPEMTDCDSADLESEMSINEGSYHSSGPRMHTSMPVLEDGLSSGHASDLEDDVIYSRYSEPLFLSPNEKKSTAIQS